MSSLEKELKEHINNLKQQTNENGEVVWEKQIGGSHYKDMKIQPSHFINENRLPFAEGSAIKYICRHAAKGKEQDIDLSLIHI